MKRALRFLLWVIVLAVVLTLTQAATFVGVWEVEREFLTTVWVTPLAWLGSVVLWKYAAVVLAFFVVILTAVVTVIKKSVRRRKHKMSTLSKSEVVHTHEEIRELNHETPKGVVHSNVAVTRNPSKFIRVHHDHK